VTQRTLVLVKPDGVARGLVGDVLARIERKGFRLIALQMRTLTADIAEEHYAEHKGKPFFGDLVAFITSGPLVAAVIERPEAIASWRTMMGATNPANAAPGTIRGDLATETQNNVTHGSDSPESPQNFDIIVMNPFRGASPPMHLMTREAFEIYLAHLAPQGVLAINFDLDTFEMAPLHRGMARAFGLEARWFETRRGVDCPAPISWALYTRDKDFFMIPDVAQAISPWRDDGRSELVWTDKSSNLMSILNLGTSR